MERNCVWGDWLTRIYLVWNLNNNIASEVSENILFHTGIICICTGLYNNLLCASYSARSIQMFKVQSIHGDHFNDSIANTVLNHRFAVWWWMNGSSNKACPRCWSYFRMIENLMPPSGKLKQKKVKMKNFGSHGFVIKSTTVGGYCIALYLYFCTYHNRTKSNNIYQPIYPFHVDVRCP